MLPTHRIRTSLIMLTISAEPTLPAMGAERRDERLDRVRPVPVSALPRVTFQVIDVREIVRGDARDCGRYEGLANPGVFRVETLLYSEYNRGYPVRAWTETREIFLHCDYSGL